MAATHCLLDTVSEADTAQNFCNEVKTIANDCDGALQAPHTAGASALFDTNFDYSDLHKMQVESGRATRG